ncbi:kinetochore Sim4 complex subunit FTA2-domain-containing protein [Aspergillus avenaceus]|uniref:Kinetochore Sim4 complex subunit FTA2-domain-containing protein n=1 Tax=Aspergillus avenaceus TaxID=36643 RepID=A0A5N6TQR7_ASPAV|nr:kinetochore Sim4 complex subunit FTA2-domain-containing protein [Aspergillus avenaceus]
METYLNLCVSEDILNVDEHESLPVDSDYPLLKRFAGYQDDISQPEFINSGTQGCVFRFKYNGHDLCLKVFRNWEYPRSLHDAMPFNVSRKTQRLLTPFARECRAFARLCDLQQNGTWAVRCHGWMYLSDNQIAPLKKISMKLRRDPEWVNARWAIVKDFLPGPPTSADLPAIFSNFDIAKKARILPGDAFAKNYRGPFIVDLGSSATFPFPRHFASQYSFDRFYKCCPEGVFEEDWLGSLIDE